MSDISKMDGCEGEISETISWIMEVTGVIPDLVAEPKIGEISVMFGWLPRYVETLEKIELEFAVFRTRLEIVGLIARVCDGVTDMMAPETFC